MLQAMLATVIRLLLRMDWDLLHLSFMPVLPSLFSDITLDDAGDPDDSSQTLAELNLQSALPLLHATPAFLTHVTSCCRQRWQQHPGFG